MSIHGAKSTNVQPKTYSCPKTTTPPPQDGNLETGPWTKAPWTEDFVDISTDVIPRFRTRAKMLWDDQNFYVAAEMEEPHVWATLTERDSVIFHDNDFEIFIDPDGDAKRYFEIEINALNTVWDLYLPLAYRDGGSAVNEWDIEGLQTKVHVHGTLNDPSDFDQSWVVEFAIPWECFRENGGMPCPPRPGDEWRINFSRVEWQVTVEEGKYVKVPDTPEDNWVWSPQGVIDMHQPEQWGKVRFDA
jgi:hypothetical protein